MARRLGVLTQILQPERVLMLCKTKEDVNSSTRSDPLVLLNGECPFFLVTHGEKYRRGSQRKLFFKFQFKHFYIDIQILL